MYMDDLIHSTSHLLHTNTLSDDRVLALCDSKLAAGITDCESTEWYCASQGIS